MLTRLAKKIALTMRNGLMLGMVLQVGGAFAQMTATPNRNIDLPVSGLKPPSFVMTSTLAQAASPTTQQAETQQQPAEEEKSPITLLGSEYQNGIKLMQNRFRIDYTVDEITMVFFRKFGSAPIVLVKPDGTKIFQSQADGENLFWFDTATYDMISLKNPTPGPWQAVGDIVPESRIMIISDISLHAEPLPWIIFAGEILKQTAYLTNRGKPIDYTAFRDVVELKIEFVSTNNPNFNNFGADTHLIATFEDNGKGMDERPLDGVFTGQFNLSIADGEWTPVFSVSTPMFSREQVDPVLVLLPNPIKISVDMDKTGDGYHRLKIDADRQYVDMSTLLLDGKVRFPNGDIQNFSITDMSANAREYAIVNYESGVYRIKLTAYGNTVDGREFILDVPEYSFLAEAPKPAVVEAQVTEELTSQPGVQETLNQPDGSSGAPDIATESASAVSSTPANNNGMAQQSSLPAQPVVAEQGMSRGTLITLVVLINLLIVVGGIGAIWFFTRKR